MSDEKSQVEAARAAFANDFDRFSSLDLNGSSLADAEAFLRSVSELKVRHTGKKSAIAAAKKLIGKVPPQERGEFGQLVQSVENEIVSKIEPGDAIAKDRVLNHPAKLPCLLGHEVRVAGIDAIR